MPRPPNLTEIQKKRLRILEPALREAARLGDLPKAKKVVHDLQKLLRPTGHEARLAQSKNWLFEAAMEAGELDYAKQGFKGIRGKMSKRTRLHLEATTLLAICYLREKDLEGARPYIAEVLQNDSVISSKKGRSIFRKEAVQRFEEEASLAFVKERAGELYDAEEIQKEAGAVVYRSTEDELFTTIGKSVPNIAVDAILIIDSQARGLLTASDIKFLPSPQQKKERKQVGKTIFSALKRVIWRSLCDPESEIYQAWFNNGMQFVLSKKYLTTAMITAFHGLGIGRKALLISSVALVMKLGIETYCDAFEPKGIMEVRKSKYGS